jgi:hypothetical protein
MAIRRIRINYTLYSPEYLPGTGLCLDFDTFAAAKSRARGLGCGTVLVRNFDQLDKDGGMDWWQDGRCWLFDGRQFIRTTTANPHSNKWQPLKRRLPASARQILRHSV